MVERSLSMREALGSMPSFSTFVLVRLFNSTQAILRAYMEEPGGVAAKLIVPLWQKPPTGFEPMIARFPSRCFTN